MWARSYVAFFKQVTLLVFKVYTIYKYPKPYVEFPVVNKERSLQVFLYDEYLWLNIDCEIGSLGLHRWWNVLRLLFLLVTQLLLICKYLAAGIVYIEVHLIT